MEKEFNLSERKYKLGRKLNPYYAEEDIKEFIKKREEVIQSFLKKEISCPEMWIELNKLVGDKLK